VLSTIFDRLVRIVSVALNLVTAFNPMLIAVQVLGTVLGGLAKIVGALLDVFSPFITLAETAVDDLKTVFSVVGAIFQATIQTIVDSFKALMPVIDLSGAFDFLKNATLVVATALVKFAIQVAALFGNTTFAANLIKSLQSLTAAGPKPYAVAAPEQVKTSGLEAISREMAEAAARAIGAQGAGPKKETQEDLIKQLVKVAQDANKDQITNILKLVDEIILVKTAITNLGITVGSILGAIAGGSKSVETGVKTAGGYHAAVDAAHHPLERIKKDLGIILRGLGG